MLNYKFILIILSCLLIGVASCKKKSYETLPELDNLGNNMNPKSGTQYVKLDSFRVYNNTTKILKSYISIDANAISAMGFSWSKIMVYKDGINTTFFSAPNQHRFFLDNVVSGQVIKFEFTVMDIDNRESKKSIPYLVTIP